MVKKSKRENSMITRTIPSLPQAERGYPCNVACAQDGLLLYGTGSSIALLNSSETPRLINHHNNKITSVAISPSGAWVASGDAKGTVWTNRISLKVFVGQNLGFSRGQYIQIRIPFDSLCDSMHMLVTGQQENSRWWWRNIKRS